MDKRLREPLRAIRREGLKVERVVAQGNTHVRIYIVGSSEFIVIPTSPANPSRAVRSAADDARRLKRKLEVK